VYLDGDTKYPTLVGTGTEDYMGSGWGLRTFADQYTGCLVANSEEREWAFYRYHIPDPIYFRSDCRVVMQQLGGDSRDDLRKIYEKGAKLIPVTVTAPDHSRQWNLMEMKDPPKLDDADFPLGWVNFYRKDNYSATAYFYLDKPVSDLPPLAPVAERTRGIQHTE
jgi:hypothetical protein